MAGAIASGMNLALPSAAGAQATNPPVNTPDDALKLLLDGNQRFVDRKLTFQQEDLAIIQQNTVAKQTPFASVLSCADSRVPVELVFDQSTFGAPSPARFSHPRLDLARNI